MHNKPLLATARAARERRVGFKMMKYMLGILAILGAAFTARGDGAFPSVATLDETNIVAFAKEVIASQERYVDHSKLKVLDIIHVKTTDRIKESLRVVFLRLDTKVEHKYENPREMNLSLRHDTPLHRHIVFAEGEIEYKTITVWIGLALDPTKSSTEDGRHIEYIWK